MEIFDISISSILLANLLLWVVVFLTPKAALSKTMQRLRLVALIAAPLITLTPVLLVAWLLMSYAG
jgi:hypothetical protein